MNQEELRSVACERIKTIVEDDDLWALFVRQMENQGLDIPDHFRTQAKASGSVMGMLTVFYFRFAMRHICDACDYNPHRRHGARAYSAKRTFHCLWKAKYSPHEQHAVEQHSDPGRTPVWLDVQNNVCIHYYQDLSKP